MKRHRILLENNIEACPRDVRDVRVDTRRGLVNERHKGKGHSSGAQKFFEQHPSFVFPVISLETFPVGALDATGRPADRPNDRSARTRETRPYRSRGRIIKHDSFGRFTAAAVLKDAIFTTDYRRC